MPIAYFAEQELDDLLEDLPDLLELSAVAEFTNVHVRTVRRWLEEGRLAALVRSERGYLVPKDSLRKFLLGIEPRDADNNDEQADLAGWHAQPVGCVASTCSREPRKEQTCAT